MARWLALSTDATAGGSSYDDLVAGAIPLPVTADLLVVTGAQANANERRLERDDDVRGRRAASPPIGFSAAPEMTFEGKCWTSQLRTLLRKAMGGSVSSTGVAPAAISSTVGMLQSGNLPALVATLLREEQIDRMSGCWVNSLTCNFPADGEGTMEGTLKALYHDVDDSTTVGALPAMAGSTTQLQTYMLRDINAIMGDGVGVQIGCLGGFGFTVDNNLSDDLRTTHCGGRNVVATTIDGTLHKVWYPEQHKLRAQRVTGRLDYGTTKPDRELRKIVGHAEKLVVELTGNPLASTPPSNEMIRLTFYKQLSTGGSADPLKQDGDEQSSYEFTAYLDDATGKDLEATFVGLTALT